MQAWREKMEWRMLSQTKKPDKIPNISKDDGISANFMCSWHGGGTSATISCEYDIF